MFQKDNWHILFIVVLLLVGAYYTFIEDTPRTVECDNSSCTK